MKVININTTKLLYLLTATLFISACATAGRDFQTIHLDSEPLGAKIFYKGQQVATTPALISIERSRNQHVELQIEDQIKYLNLTGDYRWKRSGAGNLLFFGFAPIGWIVDLISGEAWEYSELNYNVRFKNIVSRANLNLGSGAIAVAPPLTIHGNISDEVGRQLVAEIRKTSKTPNLVFDYDLTLPYFEDSSVDYDSQLNEAEKHNLYKALHVRKIYFSRVQTANGKIHVVGSMNDILAPETDHSEDYVFAPEQIHSMTEVGWMNKKEKIFYFLPNTIAAESSSTRTSLETGGLTFDAKSNSSPDFLGQLSKVVSTVSISHISQPLKRDDWRYRYSFGPILNFSKAEEEFPDFPPLANITFSRTNVVMGYGPNFYYGSANWTLYFNIYLMVAYQRIEADNGTTTIATSNSDITSSVELGALYHFNEHWSARFYTRTINLGETNWESIIQKATGTYYNLDYADLATSGLALGYTFPNRIYDRE